MQTMNLNSTAARKTRLTVALIAVTVARGAQDETGHQRGDGEAEQYALAGEQYLPGRLQVVATPQAEVELLDDRLAVSGVQRLQDVPVGGDHEVDRGTQAVLDERLAFGGGPLGGRDEDPRAVAAEREPALLGEGVRDQSSSSSERSSWVVTRSM